MADHKEKNAAQWRSQTWKREIAAIKGERTPKEIRDSAFISLRERVEGYYKRIAWRYSRLLSLEGERVNEFLDGILYNCVLHYETGKGTFFGYFTAAVTNTINMIKRARKRRIDRGREDISLEALQALIDSGHITDEHVKEAMADTREVEHDLVAEIKRKKLLSATQRRILDLKLEGYNRTEIGNKLLMNWLQIRTSMNNIRIATKIVTEVR